MQQIITDYDVVSAGESDRGQDTRVIDRLEQSNKKPEQLYDDGGYTTAKGYHDAKQRGVDLRSPITNRRNEKKTPHFFVSEMTNLKSVSPLFLPFFSFFSRNAISPAMAGGEVVRLLAVANAQRRYTRRDLMVLRRLAHLFALAVLRHRAAEKIIGLAHHDQLTGLVNRRLFADRARQMVETAKRRGTKAVVLYLDLDKFKPINDTYGREAGDAVLKSVADRLLGTVRRSDTVARVGGDEFVVLLHDLWKRFGETHFHPQKMSL